MRHSDFVHLHVHSQYSLLDGACHLNRLIEKAVKFKMPALAITDHGNIFGAIKFYELCLKKGIKPLIGAELYLAPESRFKKDYKTGEDSNNHLVLLARDNEGYHNLIKLVSLGWLEGFYYKPRIDKELLSKYSKGLIGLSACLGGEIASDILAGDIPKAYKDADNYVTIFGKGNFYLEIMHNNLKEQDEVNKHLLKISKELNIPLVATNDIHYLNKEEAFAHEVLLCIQTQDTISNPKRYRFLSDTFYMRSPEEMKELFKDTPQAIRNTLEVMQKCNLTLDFSQVHLPSFPLPEKITHYEYLSKLVWENLKKRYPQSSKEVTERVKRELEVIKNTGFSSYFLIIWDLVKFAKENNIPVGPGRGSAAGSIVSYILGITDIDPLKYNLLFERFLNPQRISMPDIDIDFCYEKRQEVIDYVSRRYGKENVAQIVTFGTMLARAVVRDVGRALEFSYSAVDKIAKMIPQVIGKHITLEEALSLNPQLNEIYHNDEKIKRLLDVARQLEGLSRHASTHAAGVVISDKPLMERVPLIRGQEGEVVTGFGMEELEKCGLLKMDFLGLKTLTVISETLKIIKRTQNITLDISSLPLDDKNTFRLLASGETIGVFQLESRGMREILKKLNPSDFGDIIAVLALYRPGPLGSGMVDDFIQRRQGKKKITYPHPKLEEILKETYGIILYQEQTMQIVSSLAGFTMAQADLLRKAIGKKIPEIMDEQRNLFIQGCLKRGINKHTAEKIFSLIDYFSGYGFNKSHSTAYALISYRTAYLKANFPVEFMAALLTSERNNTDKVVVYVNEAERMGIKILPPDINESFANFTVTQDKNIRFGLMAIKNVGKAALESIIEVRKTKKFEDIFDFLDRVDSRTVNKKVLESLIKSGAMDSFRLKRAQMFALLDSWLGKEKKRDTGQFLLFAPKKPEIPDIEEWPLPQILSFEKELLGLYVSAHPLSSYEPVLKFLPRKKIISLYEGEKDEEVLITGVVEKVRVITSRRNNERMAIVKFEDETASIEIFVFPRLFSEVREYLREKELFIVRGRKDIKEKTPKILASQIKPLNNFGETVKEIDIVVRDKLSLQRLKSTFLMHKGKTPVFFLIKNHRGNPLKIKTADEFCFDINQQSLQELATVAGEGNVSLVM